MATRRNATATAVEPTTVDAQIAPGAAPVVVETIPDTTPAEAPTTTEKAPEVTEPTSSVPAPIVPMRAAKASMDPMKTVTGRKDFVDDVIMTALAGVLANIKTMEQDAETKGKLLEYAAGRYNWMATKTGYTTLDKHAV